MSFTELEARQTRRRRLAQLIRVCAAAIALVVLATVGPSDVAVAGASGQSFEEWYADDDNARWFHFNEWYGADVRNASYYHLRQHFGTGRLGDQAVAIARCESDLLPTAKSPTNDHGLLQINARYHRTQFERVTGVAWNPNVYHADANARYARWLWEQQGWRPWTCAR